MAWDDPDLAIPWALEGRELILSGRDQNNPTAAELDPATLVPFEG